MISYNWDTREDAENDTVDVNGIPTIDRYRSLAVSGNTGSLHTGPITFFNIGKGFTRYEGIWQRCPMKIYTGLPFHNSRFITFSLSERIPYRRPRPYGRARARFFLFFVHLIARRWISGDVIPGIHFATDGSRGYIRQAVQIARTLIYSINRTSLLECDSHILLAERHGKERLSVMRAVGVHINSCDEIFAGDVYA